MPSEAISLALAASIYPPALAAIIALGRGTQVRLRVVLVVLAAYCTVLVTGSLMLLLFTEVEGSSSTAQTVGAGLYIAGGIALVLLGIRLLRKPRDSEPKEDTGPSRTDRYLESARTVLLLGFLLYVIPSPIYVGVVKAISDTNASAAEQLLYLVICLVIMLWLIEIPMLILLLFPTRGVGWLESVNAWFARNGLRAAAYLSIGAGVYLVGVGLVEIQPDARRTDVRPSNARTPASSAASSRGNYSLSQATRRLGLTARFRRARGRAGNAAAQSTGSRRSASGDRVLGTCG